MLMFINVKKILNKCLFAIYILTIPLSFVNGIFGIYDRTQSYNISKRESKELKIASTIIQIKKGETKIIFDNDLLQITIDNIFIIDETNLYKIFGKVNNGILTNIFENTQGESIKFDKFIIQFYKIASDYAEFRVSITNDE